MLSRAAACAGRLLAQQLSGCGGAAAAAQANAMQLQAAAAGATGLLAQLGGRRTFATNSHDIFNIHKHAPDNNWNTEFDFTPDNYKRVSLWLIVDVGGGARAVRVCCHSHTRVGCWKSSSGVGHRWTCGARGLQAGPQQ
jgi:hypothetical protein